jgi:predicted chitinase
MPASSKPASAILFPTLSPISRPPTSSAAAAVEAVLEANKDGIDNKVLLYQTPQSTWVPSTVYRYQDLVDGLRVMYKDGVANKFFFMGDDSPNGYKYGLVNIAAFLAQSMKETIQYNACDENSWDLVNGKYPLSNACGQLGQSYQDYQCSASEAHMACVVNPNMDIKATTNAKWYGAPGPLFCGSKAKHPFTGSWDYTKECNKPWANPPEFCNDYDGQKAGGYDKSSPVANSMGRTDVEGCCFWGRGVIQTTGVCNFGKLNYYLGKRAADEGRSSRYPDINFCEQPNAICDSEEHKELKWIAGMFYWVEELQSYNAGSWNYINELKKFVDGGMQGNGFINAVSGIVNRGCHNPPCAAGPVDGESERSSNFLKVLKELSLVA